MPDATDALEALTFHGLLLKQDRVLSSVVGIVTGESVRGSWWGHPRSHEIFAVLNEMAGHPDVLLTKLLGRKDTLVHRRLWPDVLAVGRARLAWQTDRLSGAATQLLADLDQTDEPIRSAGAAAKELQYRLLAVGRETHTESGRHAMALESWAVWSARTGCQSAPSEAAQSSLETVALDFGATKRALPWNS